MCLVRDGYTYPQLPSASCNDHALTETFFAARAQPTPPLPSVGVPAQGVYVADKGFAGDSLHERWQAQYGATVVSPPHQRSKVRWSKAWRRWLAGLRQIIESIYDKLLNTFRLARERPCISFACGSMGNLGATRWPLPSCSSGKVIISIHTKRLREGIDILPLLFDCCLASNSGMNHP